MPTEIRQRTDLRERALQFALSVLRLTGHLPKTPEGQVARNQLARAASSVGANIEEADGAWSRKDKRRSFIIARKEAQEARYWLRLVQGLWGRDIPTDPLVREATELRNILSTIATRLAEPPASLPSAPR